MFSPRKVQEDQSSQQVEEHQEELQSQERPKQRYSRVSYYQE
jgi:hypothetical protein